MSWFIFSILCLFAWGIADLFYKIGTTSKEKYSPLKTAVSVGFIMGISSFVFLPLSETLWINGHFSVQSFIEKIMYYSPASIGYILSMTIGYFGLRYLEISIVSPIQNASGAFSMLFLVLYYVLTNNRKQLVESIGIIDYIGTAFIIVGILLLAIYEKKDSSNILDSYKKNHSNRFLALIFPILYCVFDTIGTSADGLLLDENAKIQLGEFDVIVLYGFTFFIFALFAWIYISIKEKKPYNLFMKSQIPKGLAACCEEIGQIFYVYAMARNPVLAAPLVSSYCIVSIILSRLFINERLKIKQYVSVSLVVFGIVLLGVSEGLSS